MIFESTDGLAAEHLHRFRRRLRRMWSTAQKPRSKLDSCNAAAAAAGKRWPRNQPCQPSSPRSRHAFRYTTASTVYHTTTKMDQLLDPSLIQRVDVKVSAVVERYLLDNQDVTQEYGQGICTKAGRVDGQEIQPTPLVYSSPAANRKI